MEPFFALRTLSDVFDGNFELEVGCFSVKARVHLRSVRGHTGAVRAVIATFCDIRCMSPGSDGFINAKGTYCSASSGISLLSLCVLTIRIKY